MCKFILDWFLFCFIWARKKENEDLGGGSKSCFSNPKKWIPSFILFLDISTFNNSQDMSATVVSLDPLVKPLPTVEYVEWLWVEWTSPSKYFDVQDKVEDPLAVERVIESMFPPDLYTEKTDDYDTYIKNINKQYFKVCLQWGSESVGIRSKTLS